MSKERRSVHSILQGEKNEIGKELPAFQHFLEGFEEQQTSLAKMNKILEFPSIHWSNSVYTLST